MNSFTRRAYFDRPRWRLDVRRYGRDQKGRALQVTDEPFQTFHTLRGALFAARKAIADTPNSVVALAETYPRENEHPRTDPSGRTQYVPTVGVSWYLYSNRAPYRTAPAGVVTLGFVVQPTRASIRRLLALVGA